MTDTMKALHGKLIRAEYELGRAGVSASQDEADKPIAVSLELVRECLSLLCAIPAADKKEIEDLWFTNAALPILAMSADSENPCVLKLFFRQPVTRQDRDNVIAAQNALLRERAALAPPADVAGEVEAIRERVEKGVRNHPTAVEAQKDRATLLRLLDAERARRVEVEKAARQLLNGASGHYMNAEDRWCLESLLGFYDEDMPATHKDTQDE